MDSIADGQIRSHSSGGLRPQPAGFFTGRRTTFRSREGHEVNLVTARPQTPPAVGALLQEKWFGEPASTLPAAVAE
ncbi:hypothetical protein X769_08030 [Mesorhizobium sp. LSJC268A00]|nr:hypothetical protein X771_14910 [Mesorhizobium sp. LSJC277A00]ESW93828.1 hypothetical protein X770_01370 [Mesorhizobium sp. LSJC269B00]ESX07235.1 hypothetical protein X769_08030 [Mesorhizobium sp. LSJC268A00]ESX27835.1 hypothetical protein X767_03005 [Mesorhizobium sp. LSJC264A00]ESZ37492.1 hypothetical protein X733_01130 [Mesorhizobium sp. L2C067A000]